MHHMLKKFALQLQGKMMKGSSTDLACTRPFKDGEFAYSNASAFSTPKEALEFQRSSMRLHPVDCPECRVIFNEAVKAMKEPR